MSATTLDQVFTAANVFGCTLNGKEATLDVSPKTGLALVKARDESDRAVFNWSVATVVMRERKGAFVTRGNETMPQRRWGSNPFLALI